ncbi:AMP-binding protein [Aurantivibrio plasticivorans]
MSDDKTTLDVIERSVKDYKHNRAFTCLGKSLTYGEVDEASKRFAAWIQTQTNLKPGDRFAIQLPNILQYPVALFGAIRAGLVIVNVNPLYTPRELKHQLNDSGAKGILVLANVAHTLAEVVEETGIEYIVVTEVADLHPFFKRMAMNFALKYVLKEVPPFSIKKFTSFLDTLKTPSSSFQRVERSPEDIAVLQYTGGTTGVAKGAMLTHANLVANKDQLLERQSGLIKPGVDTYVAPLPLYHIYAFTLHAMSVFSNGNHNLLIPNPRDINAFVKALKTEKVYGFVGLNTLFNALLDNEEFKGLDFSTLNITSSGGMALATDTGRRWKEVTGVTVTEGYGLTETSPVACANPPEAIQLGSVGLPVKDTELKVIDEEGQTLGTGEVGELCIRGPQVMKGYWQRPEATEKVLDAEGWFKTGDMATIAEDGYVRIVDRKKDMILVSGFNVYPNEVEDVLCDHPDIVEAGVIAVPDDKSGEAVKAYVVSSNPQLTTQAVREYCKENMAGYKVPKSVVFTDSLPKSAVGKILRRELKALEGAE